jgi:uncharacterized membrane protein YbhN (UPF0104 family)
MGWVEGGRPTWKGVAVLTVKLALSTGLMIFLFSRISIADLRGALRTADPAWLIGAFGLLFASNVLGSYQWARLLHAVEIRIPFWKVCAYYHVGLFFNNFLPAGIGGDIVRVVDASRHGPTRGAAISTVVMDRLIGTVALGGVALFTTLPAIDAFHLGVAYFAVVSFFAAGVVLVWGVFHPGLLPAMERALSRVGLGGLKPHLDELAIRLGGFRDRRRLLVGLIAVAVVVQIARVGVHILVARSLQVAVPVPYFFLFVPLLAVIVSLPISFNGIGVREGAGILLFGLVGVDRAHAFSLQFTTYLVAVGVSLIGALVFVGRLPRRAAQARQLRRTS